MNSPAITTDAILTSFRTRQDRSLSFTGCTPELGDEEMVAFMRLRQRNVKLIIQPTDSIPDGLVEIRAEFDAKTPGQRLRGVLYVLHQQLTLTHKIAIPFPDWYLSEINRLIQSIKDQLEPPQF